MKISSPTFWAREQVAERLTISTATLLKWESRGLVEAMRIGDAEGYGGVEIRRIWTILTFQRDLGINLAGVEVILRLLDERQMCLTRLDLLAREFRSILDEPYPPDTLDG